MQVTVCRMGALLHYAIPRAFQARGMLKVFFTDLWSGHFPLLPLRWLPAQGLPAPVTRLRERFHPGLPGHKVRSFPSVGFQYYRQLRNATSLAQTLRCYLEAGDRFCERIISRGIGGSDLVHVSNTQGLKLLRHARNLRIQTCMEQTMAPYAYERKLLTEEKDKCPGWEDPYEEAEPEVSEYCSREFEEWKLSDTVLCGSEFVREAIREMGGPVDKCKVVPYVYEGDAAPQVARSKPHKPLRVLVGGTVCLRKGIHYVAETAKLTGKLATYRCVGPVRVSAAAQEQLKQRLDLYGGVPRSEMSSQYDWADVFLLPSLCEGSATVCYEAMSSGLPVVCTPNTGSMVVNGKNGFLVPIREAAPIAACLERLANEPYLLEMLSRGALETRAQFTLEAYAGRLAAALGLSPVIETQGGKRF